MTPSALWSTNHSSCAPAPGSACSRPRATSLPTSSTPPARTGCVEQAHTRYVVDRVRAIHAGLHSPDEAFWVDTLDAEWPDVRAVVRRGLDTDDADTVISIVVHLAFEFLFRRPEAFSWITEAVARWADRPGPHRHELLGAGGFAAFTCQDLAAAVELSEKAMAADPAPGTAIDFLPEGAAMGAYFFTGQAERGYDAAARVLDAVATESDQWKRAHIAATLLLVSAATGTTDDATGLEPLSWPPQPASRPPSATRCWPGRQR
jgi:hypothetical protein